MKAYSYIRFSTPEQEKGDSLRRQTEYSEKVAVKLGLVLDDRLRLTDRGLSAYKGDHRTKGALGEFLKLVENGSIESGSVLIIEALDRLSREGMLEAIHLLTGILLKGIDLYTAMDDKHFRKSTYDLADLIISATKLQQGHEESEKKSMRLKEAWGNKRKEAVNGHKLTKTCPAWLKLSKDRKRFEIQPEAAEVINFIFHKKLEGIGVDTIVRLLNEQGVWRPPSGVWARSYLEKILRNRGVFGEYQPHHRVAGKRLPAGEPIQGYFPGIVPKDVFDRVLSGLQANQKLSGHAGGKVGPVNNLFSHMARCGNCGASMAFVHKGPAPKGYRYLICDHARRGTGCTKHFLRYDRFETLILTYCKGLDPAEIMPGKERIQSELSILKNQLQALEGEIAQADTQINNLLDNLEVGEAVAVRLKARQEQKVELEKQRNDLGEKIAKASTIEVDTQKQLESIQDLISRMAELDGQERINLRLNLRGQLRRLLDEIKVFPDKGRFGLFFRSSEWRGLTLGKDGQVLVMDGKKEWKIPMFFQV